VPPGSIDDHPDDQDKGAADPDNESKKELGHMSYSAGVGLTSCGSAANAENRSVRAANANHSLRVCQQQPLVSGQLHCAFLNMPSQSDSA
jgi:hypothetical protein